MKPCKVSTMAPRAKAGSAPLEPTYIKVMSHHNNNSSRSVKILNELAKIGKKLPKQHFDTLS